MPLIFFFLAIETSTEINLKKALKCPLSQTPTPCAASAVNVLARRYCLSGFGFCLFGVLVLFVFFFLFVFFKTNGGDSSLLFQS